MSHRKRHAGVGASRALKGLSVTWNEGNAWNADAHYMLFHIGITDNGCHKFRCRQTVVNVSNPFSVLAPKMPEGVKR